MPRSHCWRSAAGGACCGARRRRGRRGRRLPADGRERPARAWPSWNPGVSSARLRGDLAVGATFDWQTHGLVIASTVAELVPGRRVVWGGPAHGIEGVHVWTFEEIDGGVLVRTRESWAGPPVEADPEGMRAALEGSLRSWLAALTQTALKQTR
ncbi:SRPBCC family protein [Microbispora catharanthi]|uniref:SRPBCC family protein n=1 Tax=Microbispora catharanthi TaxID=1712871 RepID=UPI001F0F594E|nr:SRPBCC family protein [Microbispora catharanthi]